jgi:DNA helicase HerA-like ATPase
MESKVKVEGSPAPVRSASLTSPTLAFDVADLWPAGPKDAPFQLRQNAVKNFIANHSIIVGQSRSGKTSAARRLIEEIIAWTDARVVILDPNADFQWLKTLDPEKSKGEDTFAKRWGQLGDSIFVASRDTKAWGIRWGRLSPEEMAAFLRLTPSEEFAEYRHLDRHIKYHKQLNAHKRGEEALEYSIDDFIEDGYFEVAVGEEVERYRLRLLDLSKREVWWSDEYTKDLDTLIQSDSKAVVVDLSTDDEQVRMITAARALEKLWQLGLARRPEFIKNPKGSNWTGTVVLMDEAHLFAPPETTDPQKRLVSERIQRFADQGKKLNLYLLLLTQQPGKLHPTVLAEFNNRIVLRVNEKRSLKAMEEMYGGIPGRYDGALTFTPGEALIEGDLLSDEIPPPAVPRGIKFKEGRTTAGGGTPPATWALPRSDQQK